MLHAVPHVRARTHGKASVGNCFPLKGRQKRDREKSVASINMTVDVRGEKKNETRYITSRKIMTPMTGIKILSLLSLSFFLSFPCVQRVVLVILLCFL